MSQHLGHLLLALTLLLPLRTRRLLLRKFNCGDFGLGEVGPAHHNRLLFRLVQTNFHNGHALGPVLLEVSLLNLELLEVQLTVARL